MSSEVKCSLVKLLRPEFLIHNKVDAECEMAQSVSIRHLPQSYGHRQAGRTKRH